MTTQVQFRQRTNQRRADHYAGMSRSACIHRAEREAEVLYMAASGHSAITIAKHAGLSRERIYQINTQAFANPFAIMLATVRLTFPPTS